MKVFLCYPHELEATAREVKGFIRSVGIECWFDKDSLLAGEDWDRSREIALKQSDLVLVLCGPATTSRNGVYQRELNEALKLSKDKRAGTIYLIPFRVDDCELPDELTKFHYVNYFEPAWRRKVAASLMKACNEAKESIPGPLTVAAAQPDEGGVVAKNIEEDREAGTLSLSWIEYELEGEYWEFVNSVIRSRALGGLYETRRQFADWWKTGSDWTVCFSEFYRKGDLVSLTIGADSYFAGAAHPNHGVTTINILGPEAGIVGIEDLFDSNPEALKFLNDYVNLDLRRQSAELATIQDLTAYAEIYGWDLYAQYNFNEAGMQLNFSSMSGLPHVLGFVDVYVPWESVRQFLSSSIRSVIFGDDD